jgi:hypothetical protein
LIHCMLSFSLHDQFDEVIPNTPYSTCTPTAIVMHEVASSRRPPSSSSLIIDSIMHHGRNRPSLRAQISTSALIGRLCTNIKPSQALILDYPEFLAATTSISGCCGSIGPVASRSTSFSPLTESGTGYSQLGLRDVPRPNVVFLVCQ